MLAIMLSIFFPGLGQIYYGRTKLGVVLILLSLIPFLYPVALVWSIVDIVRAQKRGAVPSFSSREAGWMLAVVFIIMPIGAGVIAFSTIRTVRWITETRTKPAAALVEGNEIVAGLEGYREHHGHYPSAISEMIGTRPLRRNWLSDPWGEPYGYARSEDSTTYSLVSKGKDRALGTGDDVRFR